MKSHVLSRSCVLAVSAALAIGGFAATARADDGSTDTTVADTTADTTATTLPAPVVAATSTITLPLFGAPLTIDVSTDPGGALASVSINPADSFTAVTDRSNRVAFVNADGTAKVRVNAGHGGDQVKVSGTGLADIVGPGGWSGDVFGTGATTTVSFAVADKGDGTPDITGVTSSDPSATIGATGYHSSGRGSSARASVTFQSATDKRVLWISATVSTHDGATVAGVAVSLSDVRALPQAVADAAGVHSWDGQLCDGTAAHIEFTVGTDASVSAVTATPAGATVDARRGRTSVSFATGERVSISVREHDGQVVVNVDPSFRCDTADPAVNTPVSTTVPDDHGQDGNGPDDHSHDGSGRDGSGHGGQGGSGQNGSGQGGSGQGGSGHGGGRGGSGRGGDSGGDGSSNG